MKRKFKIGVIPGDGIGRDVIKGAQILLDTVNRVAEDFSMDFLKMDTGDAAPGYGKGAVSAGGRGRVDT